MCACFLSEPTTVDDLLTNSAAALFDRMQCSARHLDVFLPPKNATVNRVMYCHSVNLRIASVHLSTGVFLICIFSVYARFVCDTMSVECISCLAANDVPAILYKHSSEPGGWIRAQ